MKKFKKAFLCGTSKYSEDEDGPARDLHNGPSGPLAKVKSSSRSHRSRSHTPDKGDEGGKKGRNGHSSTLMNGTAPSQDGRRHGGKKSVDKGGKGSGRRSKSPAGSVGTDRGEQNGHHHHHSHKHHKHGHDHRGHHHDHHRHRNGTGSELSSPVPTKDGGFHEGATCHNGDLVDQVTHPKQTPPPTPPSTGSSPSLSRQGSMVINSENDSHRGGGGAGSENKKKCTDPGSNQRPRDVSSDSSGTDSASTATYTSSSYTLSAAEHDRHRVEESTKKSSHQISKDLSRDFPEPSPNRPTMTPENPRNDIRTPSKRDPHKPVDVPNRRGIYTKDEDSTKYNGNRAVVTEEATVRDLDGAAWEYHEFTLLRNDHGLGFSISGGVDNYVPDVGSAIIVTKLIPGGTAMKDGRLRTDDVILSVNGIDVQDVAHEDAVEALKKAGKVVKLTIKRRPGPVAEGCHQFTLKKGSLGLGFSISGGTDNEHLPGDTSIYVTKVIVGGAADIQGDLKVGDILLKVNEKDFDHVTHEGAVSTLKALPNNTSVRLLIRRSGEVAETEGEPTIERDSSDPRPSATNSGIFHPVAIPQHEEDHQLSAFESNADDSFDQVDRCSKLLAANMDYLGGSGKRNPSERVNSPLITELKEKLRLKEYEAEARSPKIKTDKKLHNGITKETPPENVQENGICRSDESVPSSPSYDYTKSTLTTLSKSYPKDQIRKVHLKKGPQGLGFNIVGGEEMEDFDGTNGTSHSGDEGELGYGKKFTRVVEYGIYVSHVVQGGAADLNGNIRKGDQILAVNGNDLTEVTHDQAAHILKSLDTYATIYLIHKPEEFEWYESRMNDVREKINQVGRDTDNNVPETNQGTLTSAANRNSNVINALPAGSLKTSQKRSLFVRALFDYDSGKDKDLPNRGLDFQAGDVLHVTNASDEEWWQARKCGGLLKALTLSTGQEVWFDRAPFNDGSGRIWPPIYGHAMSANNNNIASHNSSPSGNNSGVSSNRLSGSSPNNNHEAYAPNTGIGDSSIVGLIPSKRRVERKERIRNKSVKFQGNYAEDPNDTSIDSNKGGDRKRKNFSFTKKFPFMKSKEYLLNEESNHLTHAASDLQQSMENMPKPSESELSLNRMSDDQPILSYQQIVPKSLPYARPVIILGPLKDRINDDLINENPDKFGSCVPHTTRAMREYESDGRDYHFVPSVKEMEQNIQNHLFIEAGQYNGNLYGTSIAAVKEIAQSGKHCVLDVSGNAIKRLIAADIFPIVIYIKPESPTTLRELSEKMTDDEAVKACEKAQKIEQDFASYFTGTIQGKSFEDIHKQVLRIIDENSDIKMWTISDESI